MGVEEVPNPVCTVREGFLEEVISQDGKRNRSQLGEGWDRRKYPGVTGFQTPELATRTKERKGAVWGSPRGRR